MQEAGSRVPMRLPRVFFGWWIVAGSIATNALLSAAFFQGFSALLLPIEQTFGWSRSTTSGAGALRQLEAGIVSPFIGLIIDRFSARLIVIVSAWVAGLGLIGLALMNSVVTFYFFFLVISLGASGLSHAVTWPVLIARWFRRKRGIAIGLAVMGPIVGSPFVILNTSLEEAYGWRAVLFGYGVLVLVGGSLLSLLARDRPEPYGMRPDGDPPEDEAPASTEPRSQGADTGGRSRPAPVATGFTLKEVLKIREFWILSLFLSGMFVVNSALQFHLIPYFEEDQGFSSAAAATTLTLVFFASGFGRIGSGFFLDNFDYRLVLGMVALLMGASLLYLQIFPADSILRAMPFVIVFGVGLGAMIPLRGALGGLLFGTRAIGSIIGLLQGGAIAAGVIGPIFMGALFDLEGNYTTALWILVALSAAMVPVATIMRSPEALARERSASGRF